MEGDGTPSRKQTPRGKSLRQLIRFNSEADEKIHAGLKAFISFPRPKLPQGAVNELGLIVPGFNIEVFFKQHAITNEPFLCSVRDALLGAISDLDGSDALRGNLWRINVVWEPWPLWEWKRRQKKGCFRVMDVKDGCVAGVSPTPQPHVLCTRYGFALAQTHPDHPFHDEAFALLPRFAGLNPGQLAPWDVESFRFILGHTIAFLASIEQATRSGSKVRGLPGRRRKIDPEEIVRFVRKHKPRLAWKQLRAKWNKAHDAPNERYSTDSAFRSAYERAEKALKDKSGAQ